MSSLKQSPTTTTTTTATTTIRLSYRLPSRMDNFLHLPSIDRPSMLIRLTNHSININRLIDVITRPTHDRDR